MLWVASHPNSIFEYDPNTSYFVVTVEMTDCEEKDVKGVRLRMEKHLLGNKATHLGRVKAHFTNVIFEPAG